MPLKLNNAPFFLFSACLFLLAWFIQDQLFLNWDVSMLLNATSQFLAGGSYTEDFFTPNPPMILYLYALPFVIATTLKANLILIFRICLFALILTSFLLTYSLSKHKLANNPVLLKLFIVTLLIAWLILPFHEFGQREHLVTIFIMPYILLVANRLDKKTISIAAACGIGLFAALGFAIKPQFLFPFFLIEVYFIICRKNIIGIFRPETYTITLSLCLYLGCVYIFNPDYFTVIVPFMWEHYYESMHLPFLTLASNFIALFSLFPIILFFIEYPTGHDRTFTTLLFLTLIGFLLSYFSQGTIFYYHLIPVFTFALLLTVALLVNMTEKLGLFFPSLIASALVLFPGFIFYYYYEVGRHFKKQTLMPLITFIQKEPPHRSIQVISKSGYSSPLIHYTDATNAQRLDCIWMVNVLQNMLEQQGEATLRRYLQSNDKYFFLNLIAEDLHRHQPDIVLVDIKENNTGFGHFDYLKYFSLNHNFNTEWQHYRYDQTLGNGESVYYLQVYKRKHEEKA